MKIFLQNLIHTRKVNLFIINLVLASVLYQNSFAAVDVWVRPDEIKFDYDGNSHTDDALTILNADGTAKTIPEYKYSVRNQTFAYIKGQTGRKIQVSFDSNCENMHLIINLTVMYTGIGPGVACNYFVTNYTRNEYITLNLEGTIPSNLDSETYAWRWQIYAIPDDISNYCSNETVSATTHTYYTYGTTPIWVKPFEISFNYESGNTYDALTITDDYGDEMTVPEWKYNVRSEPFAYIKNQADRRIKVSFDSNCDEMDLIINLTITDGDGFGTISNYIVSDYSKKEWITLPINGTVLSTIEIDEFTWEWEIYATPSSHSTYYPKTSSNNTNHIHYVLYSTPLSNPMSEPWSSVLQIACDWAVGQANDDDILSIITDSLYNSGVVYDGGLHYTTMDYTSLDLTSLLSDFDDPGSMNMDCRDFSNFLQVLTNAVGVSVQYNRIIEFGDEYEIECNALLPAGGTVLYDNSWNFHQVGWYDSQVADAATKIDNDSSPDISPHSWKLPIGDMTFNEYESKLSKIPIRSEEVGKCSVY